jgi:hypothetical protein
MTQPGYEDDYFQFSLWNMTDYPRASRAAVSDNRLFIGEVMTIEKSPDRGSPAANPRLVHRREYLIQGPIWVLGNQSKDPVCVLLRNKTAVVAVSAHSIASRGSFVPT